MSVEKVAVWDFCEITDNKLKHEGLGKGQQVLLVGRGVMPINKANPYQFEEVFLAVKVVDGRAQIKEGDPKPFTVKGIRLKKLDEGLTEQLKLDFDKEVEAMGRENDTAD